MFVHPRTTRDHPRVCGEHTNLNASTYVDRGSSPRMRGAHHDRRHQDHIERIIPAYAGSTIFRNS